MRSSAAAGRHGVKDELEQLLAVRPRTGVRNALVRVGPAVPADASGSRLRVVVAAVEDAVRSGDGVAVGGDDDVLVLLRGVQDLQIAIKVARKVCAAATAVVPSCAGVTLANRGESAESVLVRARGALDLAREAGPGQVISSPPWP